jgi:hypothetical protein
MCSRRSLAICAAAHRSVAGPTLRTPALAYMGARKAPGKTAPSRPTIAGLLSRSSGLPALSQLLALLAGGVGGCIQRGQASGVNSSAVTDAVGFLHRDVVVARELVDKAARRIERFRPCAELRYLMQNDV